MSERVKELEGLLYSFLLLAGGDEGVYQEDLYEATWKALGLPERMAELKAQYFQANPEGNGK